MKRKNRRLIFEIVLFFVILVIVFFGSDMLFSVKSKLNVGINIKKVGVIDFKNREDNGFLTKIINLIDLKFNKKSEKVEENLQNDTTNLNIDTENNEENNEVLINSKKSNEQVFVVDDSISIFSNSKLTNYDKKGKIIYSTDINTDNLGILKSKKYIYMVNYNSGDIIKLNKNNKIVKEIYGLGNISEIKVVNNFPVIFLNDKKTFIILDENLNESAVINISFGDVQDYIISDDEKIIAINLISIENYELKSYILQYDFLGKMIGINDLSNEIVYKMFMGENLKVVCDASIRTYDRNGYIISNIENKEIISDISMNSDKIYLLTLDENDMKKMTIYSDYGDIIFQDEIKESIDNIISTDKYILTYNDSEIRLYDTRYNFISKSGINLNIVDVQWLDENSFIVVGDNRVYVYEII